MSKLLLKNNHFGDKRKPMGLSSTPLLNAHKKLNAKITTFAGWLMPLQYGSIIAEHLWTRNSCSLFDTCHMGELIVYGTLKQSNLNKILPNDLEKIKVGKCSYSFMLNERGGIIDDLVIYKLEESKWMLVVNAGTLDKDYRHLKSNIRTSVENISPQMAKLDLQGPLSREVLRKFVGTEIDKLKYYHFDYFSMLGEKIIISRTGYTGELGYELYVNCKRVKEFWNSLLTDERVKPAGLGARDTLRLEMGYPLYGQDITEETTPLEAGLERILDFRKEFVGKQALLKQKQIGISKKLVCFMTHSRRSPRQNYKLYFENQQVGFVTSGSFSPCLSCGIGMGYIKADHAQLGTKVVIKGHATEMQAVITAKPFYKNGSLKK